MHVGLYKLMGKCYFLQSIYSAGIFDRPPKLLVMILMTDGYLTNN